MVGGSRREKERKREQREEETPARVYARTGGWVGGSGEVLALSRLVPTPRTRETVYV